MIAAHMTVFIQNPARKTFLVNLAKRIIVLVTVPEEIESRLNELRTWLKK